MVCRSHVNHLMCGGMLDIACSVTVLWSGTPCILVYLTELWTTSQFLHVAVV